MIKIKEISKINDKLVYFQEKLGKLIFALIIVLVFSSALLRFIGISIAWSMEIAQLFFGWITFIGADLALRQKEHIGIEIIVNSFPDKLEKIIYYLHYVIMIVFLAFIMYYGFDLAISNWSRSFNTINLSYSYATMSVAIGSLLMLRTIVERLIKGDVLPKSQEK
mgnify:CR=1 FL=1